MEYILRIFLYVCLQKHKAYELLYVCLVEK